MTTKGALRRLVAGKTSATDLRQPAALSRSVDASGRSKVRSGGRHRPRGQAIVEFALIFPVFMLLTIGVVDMARVFTYYVALTSGVSNAALFAGQGGYGQWCSGVAGDVACPPSPPSTSANPNNIAYQIQVEATGLTLSDIHMSAPQCTPPAGPPAVPCAPGGTYAKVTIAASYDMALFTPLMTVLLGGPLHMTAQTTAVIQ